MKKAKRVMALIGVILLLSMYGCTMVFACMKSSCARPLFMASLYCTIAVPVVIYGMMLVAKLMRGKNNDSNQTNDGDKKD